MRRSKFVLIAIVFLLGASLACSLSAPERNQSPEKKPETKVLVQTAAPPTPMVTPLQEQALVTSDIEEELLINIYERANPAVVNIDVAANDFEGDLSGLGSGSGFVYDKEGHVVTNNHVVAEADEVRVTFSDGRVVVANLVARDLDSDLAVLKVDVDPSMLHPLELGDSNTLKVGQRVVAIGNPYELGGTMTVGIISALGRSLQGRDFYSIPDIIQTDAAINPGNSGGPLLDSEGQVVGINTAIRSEGRFNSGVGFAVPINIMKRVVPALITEGRYRYPYLGISSNTLFTVGELALVLDLPVQRGVLISDVRPDGPAIDAGIQGGDREIEVWGMPVNVGGDIILAIDDYQVRDFDDLIAYLVRETSVGQEVTLTVLRDENRLQFPLTLVERP